MCKFNCRFVNKIIIFLKALQFKDVFIFYYNRQNVIKISEKVSLFITWHILKIILDFFHLLWMLVFWINLMGIGYFLMHCNLLYECAWNSRKNSQIYQPKSLWLMMILGLFLSCLVCFQHQKWKLGFFKSFLSFLTR
jgi:hypothetical protein